MLFKQKRSSAPRQIQLMGLLGTLLVYLLAALILFSVSYKATKIVRTIAVPDKEGQVSLSFSAVKPAVPQQQVAAVGKKAQQQTQPQDVAEQAGQKGMDGDEDEELSKLIAALARRFEELKRYPPAARRSGLEGSMELLITVDSQGHIRAIDKEGEMPGVLLTALDQTLKTLQAQWQPVATFTGEVQVVMTATYRLR